ncbi:MAG: ROK family protein [Clostridia bacterium]|nr:ROK family protein [Clostridia bacterium]
MYNIGIDLGGTNIAVGLVNEKHEIVVKRSTPTLAKRGADAILEDMAKLCFEVCREANTDISEIGSVGIATPGVANSEDGVAEYCNNIYFRNYPIVAKLKELTGAKTVKLENDANAAALGEAVAGAARGARISMIVTLGTGVGGGIIIDGKVYSGFNFVGGEIGHMVIEKGGVPCSCGRRGCWEVYSSATALSRMTKEKIEEYRREGRYTSMFKAPKISGRTACDAMRRGDAAGKEVYEAYVDYLATGLANVINIFQPEIISLGGGVSNEGQSLIDDLLPKVRKQTYGYGFIKLTDIRIAALGNDAGIIGAAAL